jgi:hypothetical protein
MKVRKSFLFSLLAAGTATIPALAPAALTTSVTQAALTTPTNDGALGTNEYGAGNSQKYAGAGTGFGGVLAGDSIYMAANATNLYLALDPGADLNDNVVIFLNTRAGGFTDADMDDDADGGRSLASNVGPFGNDTFPGMSSAPDFALVIGNFGAVMFELNAGSADGHLEFKSFSGTHTGNSPTLIRENALTWANLDEAGPVPVEFFVAYGAPSFLSNESVPPSATLNAGLNPGNTATATYDNHNRFFPYSLEQELATNWSLDAPLVVSSAAISNIALTTNVVTVTTGAAHGLEIGQRVRIVLTTPNPVFDGEYTITGTPSTTTFTYARTNANVASAAVTGTAGFVALTTNNENRGMDYNPATGNVLLGRATSPPGISRFDAATGAYVGEVNRAVGGALVNASVTANVATIETTTPHGFSVGQFISMANMTGAAAVLNGTNRQVTAVTATTVSFALTTGNFALAAPGGFVTPLAGGTVTLGKVKVASGAIYASNIIINANNTTATSSDYLTIYRWASETAEPQVIYRNNAAPNVSPTFAIGPQLPAQAAFGANNPRYGDGMDVVANGDTGNTDLVQIYFQYAIQSSGGPADKILRLNFDEATNIITTEFIPLTGVSTTNTGATAALSVDGFNGKIYRAVGAESAVYNNDGTNRSLFTSVLGITGMTVAPVARFGTLYGTQRMAFLDTTRAGGNNRPFSRAGVADIDLSVAGTASSYWAGFAAAPSPNYLNANNTGDVAFDNQTLRPGRFFAMASNNRLSSITATNPATSTTKRWDGGAADGQWFSPTNWAPDGVPTAYDNVILDNTNVAGAYTVTATGNRTAIARTLNIDGGVTNNAIELKLASFGQEAGTVAGIQTGSTTVNNWQPTAPVITGTFTAPTVNNNQTLNPEFRIEILTPTTFRWNTNNSSSAFANGTFIAGATGVAFTPGTPVALTQGYSVTFPASATYVTPVASGVNQCWVFTPKVPGMCLAVAGDRTTAADLTVARGGYINNESGSNSLNTNTITNWGTGNTTLFADGGSYRHASNRSFTANFPASTNALDGKTTFNAGSTVTYDVFGGLTPGISAYVYGNVTLANSYPFLVAPYNPTVNTPNAATVNGALTLTGNTTSTWSGTGTVVVGGNIVNNSSATAPQATISAALTADGTTVMSGTGTTNLTGALTVNAGDSLTLAGNQTVPSITSNGTLTSPATLTTAGAVNLGAAGSITGAGSLVLSTAAQTVSSANPAGVAISTAGPNTIPATTNFTLNGTVAQSAAGVPATVGTLLVNNPAGVTLASAVTATNLTLTDGAVATGANVLTATNVARTTGYVDGTLTRTIDGAVTGARSFPVGAGASYAPVTVDITAAGTGVGTIAVNTANAAAAGVPASVDEIARNWNVDATGISGATYSLGFEYLTADLGSIDETTLVAARFDGSNWAPSGTTTVNAATNVATTAGVTALSPWTLYKTNGTPGTSTGSLAFGNVTVTSNADLSFDVTNSGTAAFDISSIVSDNAQFTIASPASFPATVAVAGTVNVTVRFTPSSAAAASGTVTINTTAATNPTVSVSGTGVASVNEWMLLND